MDNNTKNLSTEEKNALQADLERLCNEEGIIKRNIAEYHEIIRSEPGSKERPARKIEEEEKELDRVRAEIQEVSAELDNTTSYPGINVHTYHNYHFKCRECDWEGPGSETVIVGDVVNVEVIGCPVCSKMIKFIPYPTSREVLLYGTAEDKRRAQGWIDEERRFKAEWDEKWKKYPDLESADQLPDIDAEEIIITLCEEGIGKTKGDLYKDAFLVFYWGEREIWRLPASFEYYTGYLSWGKILIEKYGERLIDFEAKETVDLGGDSFSAFDKIREFRKSLPKGKN